MTGLILTHLAALAVGFLIGVIVGVVEFNPRAAVGKLPPVALLPEREDLIGEIEVEK